MPHADWNRNASLLAQTVELIQMPLDKLHARVKAAEWFRKSADRGDKAGLWNLGKCHASGRGVPKDLAHAAALFALASEKGHAAATYYLGASHEKGLGVKKDADKAREL